MQEREWTPGDDLFLESLSPENEYGVVLEYDGETLYFYAVDRDKEGPGIRVLDALHIWEGGGEPGERGGETGRPGERGGETGKPGERGGETGERHGETRTQPMNLKLVWSKDWQKCALVIDGLCHALFDFVAHGGYNVSEFPPPNENWTRGDRKLTAEIINRLF